MWRVGDKQWGDVNFQGFSALLLPYGLFLDNRGLCVA